MVERIRASRTLPDAPESPPLAGRLARRPLVRDEVHMGGRVGPMAFSIAASHRCGPIPTDWWWGELARPHPLVVSASAVGGSAVDPSTTPIATFAAAFDRWVGGGCPYREAARDLDEDLADHLGGKAAIAATVVELVPERWEVRLTSHGALPVFLFDGERVQTVAFSPSPPVGTRRSAFSSVEWHVRPGDRLLLYSAGVADAPRIGGVRRLFAETRGLPLWQARTALRARLDRDRTPRAPTERDETFVMIEIGASGAPA